jgi:flagellar biogenesis protein FliO
VKEVAERPGGGAAIGGLAGWLMRRLRNRQRAEPRLALLERIALAPRQSLALVEAEGRRILVATSAEGGPAFYALDESVRPAAHLAARRAPKLAPSKLAPSKLDSSKLASSKFDSSKFASSKFASSRVSW